MRQEITVLCFLSRAILSLKRQALREAALSAGQLALSCPDAEVASLLLHNDNLLTGFFLYALVVH